MTSRNALRTFFPTYPASEGAAGDRRENDGEHLISAGKATTICWAGRQHCSGNPVPTCSGRFERPGELSWPLPAVSACQHHQGCWANAQRVRSERGVQPRVSQAEKSKNPQILSSKVTVTSQRPGRTLSVKCRNKFQCTSLPLSTFQ